MGRCLQLLPATAAVLLALLLQVLLTSGPNGMLLCTIAAALSATRAAAAGSAGALSAHWAACCSTLWRTEYPLTSRVLLLIGTRLVLGAAPAAPIEAAAAAAAESAAVGEAVGDSTTRLPQLMLALSLLPSLQDTADLDTPDDCSSLLLLQAAASSRAAACSGLPLLLQRAAVPAAGPALEC